MKDRITRDISDDFLKKLTTEDEYSMILNKARENECLILPRKYKVKDKVKDKVIIYYQGQKVLEIKEKEQNISFKNSFVKDCKKEWDLESFFEETKKNIELYPYKSNEKTKQQEMFLKINEENNDFFVFDMEYQQHKGKTDPRSENGGNNNPRADLVAVKSDGTLVLVELKVGDKALDGAQGIAGHLNSAKEFDKLQEEEFSGMIKQVVKLNYAKKLTDCEKIKKIIKDDFKIIKKIEYIFALIDCKNKEKIKEQLDNQAQDIKKLNWQVFFTEKEDLSELFTYDEYMKGL